MQPINAPPLASLGARMDTPTDGPKTGKDGRERGKEKAHAVKRGPCDELALERATWRLMIRVAVFLKRNRILNVIGKRSGPHTVTPRQTCVTVAQSFMRRLCKDFLVFNDISIQERFNSV